MTHNIVRSGPVGSTARRRLTAITAAFAVLVSASILGISAESASAADYPSWADVQAARNNVAAKEKQLSQLDSLLAGLESNVASTQAIAQQKGSEYSAAQQKYDESAFKAAQLQKNADAAKAKADTSKQKAGQLAAKLARSGGSDLSTRLFFSGEQSTGLLSQLGLATMVKDQSAGIYQKAIRDQNSAQALTDQATVATTALKDLKNAAETALADANAASEKAAAALTEQQANKERLEAQRAILVENKTTTEAEYNTGVQVRAAAAAAAAAAAKAAAEKAAAEWAAAHPPSTGGGTAPAGGGSPSTSGWVRPSSGSVVSSYGWRLNPASHVWALHAGTDLGAGCGAPIFAAHAGTVIFAGWSGGYGNFVLIADGDGTSTGYGHIVNGGTLVGVGQRVGAGQQIARVGSTGNSTGCHLHFETRPGGTAVDAVPFMRARGVNL